MPMTSSDWTSNDPHLVALRFQPSQLTRARELRRLTKSALASRTDKTPSAISQFESGVTKPDAQTVARLALALGTPVGFLARPHLTAPLRLDDCHFRSLKSVSQYLRREAVRIGELMHELLQLVEREGVELPPETLSALKSTVPEGQNEIELFARSVRRAWGLGQGPIPDPIGLLEEQGVRILPLSNVFDKVDAFSFWYGGSPFMMLNLDKPPSRIHFDVAHELGHLLMHDDVSPGDPCLEREADGFASAFLIPRETFLEECPSRWSLAAFSALKRRWFVSIAALVFRANKLGRLTQASQRRAYQTLNAQGLRQSEPDEWPLGAPTVLKQALTLVSEDLPLSQLAAELGLHERHLADLLEPINLPHVAPPVDGCQEPRRFG